tara:strand:- start:3545 stop:4345 length:801 start_codon:yes stop_codon:yes gene_type:complete
MSQAARPNSIRSPILAGWMCIGLLLLHGCLPSKDASNALKIFAAASLTEAFGEMKTAFEKAHPNIRIQLAFAGSQVLRLQIEQGAPADVFASANLAHLNALMEAKRVGASQAFAQNKLAIITPLDNPSQVLSFEDLAKASKIIIGTEQVPVGIYARQALAHANRFYGKDFEQKVMKRVVSQESNARLVRAKVEMGEADAALVYLTDAFASKRVRRIAVPPGLNVRADYLMANVIGSQQQQQAAAWQQFVFSEDGKDILVRHGFSVN